jgi:hypothetical protein
MVDGRKPRRWTGSVGHSADCVYVLVWFLRYKHCRGCLCKPRLSTSHRRFFTPSSHTASLPGSRFLFPPHLTLPRSLVLGYLCPGIFDGLRWQSRSWSVSCAHTGRESRTSLIHTGEMAQRYRLCQMRTSHMMQCWLTSHIHFPCGAGLSVQGSCSLQSYCTHGCL